MALNVDDMTSRIFSDYVSAFPAAASVYRRNDQAAPAVPRHRPMEEIGRLIATAATAQIASLGAFVGIGSGTVAGPGVIVAAPPYQYDDVAFPGLPATVTAATAAAVASLGWSGPAAPLVMQGLVAPTLNYIAEELSLQCSVPPQMTGSGGLLTVTIEPTSLTALTNALPIAVASEVASSPLFHQYDNPGYPPTDELVDLCVAIVSQIPVLLGTMLTVIDIVPVGSPPPTPLAAVGGLV